jgi:hypothetical protein
VQKIKKVQFISDTGKFLGKKATANSMKETITTKHSSNPTLSANLAEKVKSARKTSKGDQEK